MSVKLEFKDNVMTAYLKGEIDHHSAIAIRAEIDETMQNIMPQILKLDFANVPFMDSSGIGLILGRIRLIKRWSGRVILCNISDDITKMAKIAGVFSLVSTEKKVNK